MLNYEVSYQIDWLRWVSSFEMGLENAVPALRVFEPVPDEIKSLPYYSAARKMRVGRMDWAPDRTSQGIMVTLTGRDLEQLREQKVEIGAVLHHILLTKSSITRIDFAIDLYNSGVKPDDFLTAFEQGTLCAASKKTLRWQSKEAGKDTGVTVQFGSRQSARCLRIYDKAAEQRVEKDWIRLELEVHGRQAKALLIAMVKYGAIVAGKAAIDAFLKGTVMEIVKDVLGNKPEGVEIEPVGKKQTDWEKWMLDVALPAVEKAVREKVPGVVPRLELALYGLCSDD